MEYEKQSEVHFNNARSYIDQNWEAVNYIPDEYRTSDCVAMLHNYLLYGRADSWNEALNVLSGELHNQEMQAHQEKLLLNQQILELRIEEAEHRACEAEAMSESFGGGLLFILMGVGIYLLISKGAKKFERNLKVVEEFIEKNV